MVWLEQNIINELSVSSFTLILTQSLLRFLSSNIIDEQVSFTFPQVNQ